MSTLAPSLVRLRQEIDIRWPMRDRRTDGWYRARGVGDPSDHWPDARGIVHALDVDRDGINPQWILDHMYRSRSVIHYVIWDRRVWSTDIGWDGHRYYGDNPHTDHMHFSIYHGLAAESYPGRWGIAPLNEAVGRAPASETQWGESDPRGEMTLTGGTLAHAGATASTYGKAIHSLIR